MDAAADCITDYLTEDEKRRIATEVFRAQCEQKARGDFERILSNAAYALVAREVDAAFDGGMVETVKAKALQVIENLGTHSVFRPKDAWQQESSKGWVYLQEALDANRDAIRSRVAEIIAGISRDELRGLLEDRLLDGIVERLKATG